MLKLWTVSEVEMGSYQIFTMMSDAASLDSPVLEVVISSNNECVIIRDLTDRTLQIILDARCSSLTVGWKCTIAWNNSSHVPSWQFFYTVELKRPATLEWYVSLVIKFFATHQNMGPAQW